MGRVNSDFYRSVKVNMKLKDVNRYVPFHKGLEVNFYEPKSDKGENLLRMKGYNKDKIQGFDVTVHAKSINPNPLWERDMRDIDEELAMIDSSYRVIKDHLKHTDNKELIHAKQPKHTLLRHSVILDHPYLDGENDHLRSTATDVHDVEFTEEELRNEEEHFARRKAFYNRSKLNYVSTLNKKLGVPTVKLKMGYIGDHD